MTSIAVRFADSCQSVRDAALFTDFNPEKS